MLDMEKIREDFLKRIEDKDYIQKIFDKIEDDERNKVTPTYENKHGCLIEYDVWTERNKETNDLEFILYITYKNKLIEKVPSNFPFDFNLYVMEHYDDLTSDDLINISNKLEGM